MALIRPDSVHSSVPPPGSRHARTAESDGRLESPRKNLHDQTGPVSGLYSPLHAPAPPASGRSRLAGIFSRQPAFGSPDDANAGAGRGHQKATRNPSQHRTAGWSEKLSGVTFTLDQHIKITLAPHESLFV